MADYRISFFKNLLSSDGHPFKCLQGEIEVRGSSGPNQAIEMASHEFGLRHGSRDWRFYADLVEVAADDQTVGSHDLPPSRRAAA
jgi:hypothetical protein